ncbi:hypothetical protein [Roseateles sp.]|uniref:hypothetical protein n=1 Tax=Roseateles sp. TaxID=1971397 RepID=UPI00286CB81A|nr:hypothetical protein [Roseateles sp.]
MLTIRPVQMQAFDATAKQVFIDSVTLEIRLHLADKVADLSPDALRLRVADGLERAARYGFKKKYSLSMFIQLLFLAAPDFDQYPPIRHILQDPRLAPDDRIDHVIETLRNADWIDVQRRAARALP